MTKMTKTDGICHLQNKNSKFKTKIQITKITKNRKNCDFKNKQGCRMTRMTKMKGFY